MNVRPRACHLLALVFPLLVIPAAPLRAQSPAQPHPVNASTTTATAAQPSMAGGAGVTGVYVTLGGGFQHRQRAAENDQTYTDWKNGYALNAAVGYQMGALGVEGEFTQMNNHDKVTAAPATGPQEGVGDVTLRLYMVNANYTTTTSGPVALYVGAGIGGYKSYLHGLSNVVAKSFGFVADGSNDGFPFVYQLRAGGQFHLAERSGLLVGYRYVHGNELLFKGTAFGDLRPNGTKNHVIEAAIKIAF